MKILSSQKYWLAAFVIMTISSIVGSLSQPKWVEESLAKEPYSCRVLTGFYWKDTSSNNTETTIVNVSYLLFPGFKAVSIEKINHNGKQSITIDKSPFASYFGALIYAITGIIAIRHLFSLHRIKKQKK